MEDRDVELGVGWGGGWVEGGTGASIPRASPS